MKKLFSYLLISSMVVLSSCTNYDDQFDDLNSQINSLKSQIEGFNSLSSGLSALQGTVASLQSAVAAIPTTQVDVSGLEASVTALQTSLASAATSAEAAAIQTQLTAAQTALAAAIESNATASTTNATSIAALQTSLEAVTATLAELKTSLATASTAAEVATLTTSLAAVQADLTKLLAQNNVYSDDLVINSSASLAVAKSLGSKLSILNADLVIDQGTDMDAADLQAVVDIIVTTTGTIQYKMVNKSSTPVTFNKLTSAGNIFVDVAGDISFALLENTTSLHIGTSHSAYITSFSAPTLSKVTSFATGSTSAYDPSSKVVTITTVGAHTINLPKATSISLASLATYDQGDLAITGKLDHTLNIAKLTSKTALGSANPFDIVINGAKEVSLPLLTTGSVDASTSKTINLPLFVGGSADDFSGARTLTLGAYTLDLSTGVSLETLNFTGAKPEAADDADDFGPSVTLNSSTTVSTVTVGGVINGLNVNFAADNTSLTSLTLTGKANAVVINNANGITELDLGHTAEQAEFASLTITDNEGMTSLKADKLVSAASLTITGNDSLSSISFDALKTQGGAATALASVDVSDNDLTATRAEITKAAVTTPVADKAYAKGTFTTTSGMADLENYLIAAAARYASKGGTVYAAFDTLESYFDIDDVADPNAPYTLSAVKGAEPKLEAVYLSNAGYTAESSSSTGVTKAKRSFVLDLATAAAVVVSANGDTVKGTGTLSNNATLAAATIATEANVATAAALGVTLSASNQARGTATITLSAARNNTTENSPTSASDLAKLVGANTFNASSTVTLNINGQTVVLSDTTSTGSTNAEVATQLAALYNAKYTDNANLGNQDFTVSADGAGVITVTSKDIGSGGVNNPISVSVSQLTGTASLTNLGVKINELNSAIASSDDKTLPTASTVLVTFEAVTAGSPLSEIGYPLKTVGTGAKTVQITGTPSTLTITELTSSVTSNAAVNSGATTATRTYPLDSRADVRYPDAAVVTTTAVVGSLKDHNYISWL